MSKSEAAILTQPVRAGMSHDVFTRLRTVIYEKTGIYFHDSKQYLVESRVGQRMRALGISDFENYWDLLYHRRADRELPLLLNSITINETSFFRNQAQFDAIADVVVPDIIAKKCGGSDRTICLWSAGCATGEEAYTLAVLCLHRLRLRYPAFQFSIIGTDINTEVLASARLGEYRDYAVRNVPEEILEKYFEMDGGSYRVTHEVRNLVEFKQHNLMDAVSPLSSGRADVILCANVLIYFDLAARRRAVEHLNQHLADEGRLMVGFSESLLGVTDLMTPVRLRRATVYRKG